MTKPSPILPNPFLDSQAGSRRSFPGGFAVRPALVVFLICLVLGMAAAGWRAKRRADDARARAGLEAQVRAAAVELQFNQAMSAAEALGALARQAGGTIPNFQRVAADLLTTRPGIASLELQPNGVVSDIVPRAGNERALGFNVMNNPAYRPGADVAIQRRALTVSGPLALYRGEPGIVARVPVLQRGRDGRDSFWGFVAVSMRVSDALSRARVDDLTRRGYNYAFFAPSAAKVKAVAIAAEGELTVPGAVHQPVRARELEFHLAVQPRGGWVNWTKVGLESLGVLAVAGLVSLLVNLFESRRAVETTLAETNQRLARGAEDRKQALEDCRGAKDETAAAKAELNRTRAALQSSTEQEVRLNASIRAAEEAARARQEELGHARTALLQAEQTIRNLQARLSDAARAEGDAAAVLQTRLEVAQATIADLQERLEAATHSPEQTGKLSPTGPDPVQDSSSEVGAPPDENAASPSITTAEPEIVPPPATSPEPESPAPATPPETAVTAMALPSEPPTEKKPTRTPKRKKARPDNQMDLFAPQPTAEPATATPLANEPAEQSAAEAPSLPTPEPPLPSAATESAEPEQPAADATQPIPAAPTIAPTPKEQKPARRLPAPPPVDHGQMRKAVNLILPLFTGQDPGARDCLKDNRATFRSAFSPEGYVEFEQAVKSGDFTAALEHLKRAAERHGIPT